VKLNASNIYAWFHSEARVRSCFVACESTRNCSNDIQVKLECQDTLDALEVKIEIPPRA
jgi:hypothetical protein